MVVRGVEDRWGRGGDTPQPLRTPHTHRPPIPCLSTTHTTTRSLRRHCSPKVPGTRLGFRVKRRYLVPVNAPLHVVLRPRHHDQRACTRWGWARDVGGTRAKGAVLVPNKYWRSGGDKGSRLGTLTLVQRHQPRALHTQQQARPSTTQLPRTLLHQVGQRRVAAAHNLQRLLVCLSPEVITVGRSLQRQAAALKRRRRRSALAAAACGSGY